MENKNKNKNSSITKKLILAVVIICVVLVSVYPHKLGPYASYLKGRINYGKDIQFKELYLPLPSKWWVVEMTDKQVVLSRLPAGDDKVLFFVFLEEKKISEDIVDSFSQTKYFSNNTIARMKSLKNINLNNINISLFSYEVEEPISKKGNLYLFWVAPEIDITLSAVDIDSSYEKYFLELIKELRLK